MLMIAGGILLAIGILALLRNAHWILIILLVLYLIGSAQH